MNIKYDTPPNFKIKYTINLKYDIDQLKNSINSLIRKHARFSSDVFFIAILVRQLLPV